MKRRLPTLRSRLALRAFVYTLLALALVGVASWFAIERIISERIDTSADDYLLTLTGELEIATTPTDANVVAPIRQAGEDRIAQIVRLSDARVVTATSGLPDRALIEPSAFFDDSVVTRSVPDPRSDSNTIFIKATTVSMLGQRYGVIAGISSSSGLFENGAMAIVVPGSALLIAMGLAAGVWLSVRSALRPVESLSDKADRVASASNSERWTLENPATTAEIDHLVERLNSLLSRVHESQEHERAFLEDASHDLRTPIAVARAELDLAKSTTSEQNTREALESAIEELDRLDRLAADLLILARMRAKPTEATDRVHIGHLVRKTAARIMRDPHHRDVAVTVEGNAETLGDPFMIERAVDNIISNAIKHASKRVEIEVSSSEGQASIQVCDDGPGFPDALLTSAARRFTRDDNHGGGTGLGLSIAAAIAEAHKGSLRFDNRPERGAVVTLSLPTSPGSAELHHSVHSPEKH